MVALVNKIDSNITGLAYAEEAILGLLPGEGGQAGTPVWKRLNPNSYSDFGGEIITVAPNPINPSRQRRKGVTTDLNAAGSFNHNITYENLTDIMQGFMFADIRRKGRQTPTGITALIYEIPATAGFLVGSLVFAAGNAISGNNGLHEVTAVVTDVSVAAAGLAIETPPATATLDVVGFQAAAGEVDVDVTGDLPKLTTTGTGWDTMGLVVGQWCFVGGDAAADAFSNAVNNGWKRIRSWTATDLVFDKSDTTMVIEASTTETIQVFFGDVLRNEAGSLIVRRSYNLERTLGAPDSDLPAEIQSEVVVGAVGNEFTLNVPSAELLNVDMSFVATDNVQRDGATGAKATSVVSPVAATEYNTSSDVGRIRLATVSAVDENVSALFAFITEGTITINNNVTPNKAVGVLGAFDVTAGTFQVGGSLTAYFASTSAVLAVRNNSDVTLDMSFVKNNTGMVFDFPLIALGDGRLNVEVDQAITLPLTTEAASGEDVLSTLNHTLLITYFNYVPTAA